MTKHAIYRDIVPYLTNVIKLYVILFECITACQFPSILF